jgi:hypothetical protein
LSGLVEAGLEISSATLELRKAQAGAATNNSGVIVYSTTNNWAENTITFNNRPAAVLSGPAIFGQAPPGLTPAINLSGDNPIAVNLTNHLQSRLSANEGVISLVIAAKDFASVPNLASREFFDASRRPRLTLTLAGAPPTATPGNFTHQSVHGGEIHLAWPSSPDLRLMRSQTLEADTWQEVSGTMGKGAFAEPLESRMFYRIQRN